VAEVIGFVEGPLVPVNCAVPDYQPDCPLAGTCVFLPLWREAGEALSTVFERSLQNLVDEEKRRRSHYVPSYVI
jgi:DNA-binding IscR family transcriptional regulator